MRNILRYVENWKPEAKRKVVYDGYPSKEKNFSNSLGVIFESEKPNTANDVVGPGGKVSSEWAPRALEERSRSVFRRRN